MLKYSETIFNILSKGAFISENSLSDEERHCYEVLEENEADYRAYYEGIGFFLEGGDGYYYFTRRETKADLERKLEAAERWIDYLCFLKTFDSTFGPGFRFRKNDIETRINCDLELKEQAIRLFTDKKRYDEIVEKLVNELERLGVIALENEIDGTYKVLTAFRYAEELVDCITITEEGEDEIPE